MSNVWEQIKTHVREKLPENSYSLWISPISLLDEKDDSLVLGCPNKFSMKWIMEHYRSIMQEKLDSFGNKKNIVFKVSPSSQAQKPDLFEEPKQLTIPNSIVRKKGKIRFNKDFTFDRFVVGQCNEFAYSASRALAMGNNSYDTLFMGANTGLGKSHLSQSIGHMMLKNNPDLRAYYITAEDFVNEMIFALKNNKIDEFKNRYRRSCDVLMLEEVHFLSGKEKTQLELGHTLDALINDKKKIIFTSSLLPKDIPNMSKELSSRLNSGLITTLEKPDYDTRVKIVEKKSFEQSLTLSEDIVHLFAKNLTRDVRQIESALRCLRAKSDLLKARIDLCLAKEVLKYHVSGQGQVSLESIKNIVCQYYKIDSSLLVSKSRKKIHSFPRNMYIYLCRNHCTATLEEIGKSVNRNHSTVIYSTEVMERTIKMDNKIKNQACFLDQKIKDLL